MKHYETHFDDYVQSSDKCSLHPELKDVLSEFPSDFADFGNIIVYGPSGVGKYTQVLNILKKYSPSQLKYEKKVTLSIKKQSKKMMSSPPATTISSMNASAKKPTTTTKAATKKATTKVAAAPPSLTTANEKQCFSMTYRISDIHFEIDMSLLGCNSKQIWHELYLQMVDIVAIRPIKRGVIVCKNFHAVHSELLDNFYSYVQSQDLFEGRERIPNKNQGGIAYGTEAALVSNTHEPFLREKEARRSFGVELVYVLITEHLSFIPNQLMDRFAVLSVGRPTTAAMVSAVAAHRGDAYAAKAETVLNAIGGNENILNLKELFSLGLVSSVDALPKDNFNIVCDSLITEMESIAAMEDSDGPRKDSTHIIHFRDALYDILIYGLDAMECVWYVLHHYIEQNRIQVRSLPGLMTKIHEFAHQYGNNYRAIFHLEFVFLHILQCLHP